MKKNIIIIIIIALNISFLIGCSSEESKGEVALKLGDYKRAIGFFNRALDKNPANYRARVGLAHAYIQEFDIKKDKLSIQEQDSLIDLCVNELSAALSINPEVKLKKETSQILYRKAKILLEKGDTLLALKTLNKSLKLDKKNIASLNLSGIIFYKLGRSDIAQDYFLNIILIDSTNANAYYNLSIIALESGDLKKAKEYLDKARRFETNEKR